MTVSDQQLELAAGFEPASRDQWRALVAAVLAKSRVPIADDAAPEDALAHAGYDGFDIAPLYTADELPAGVVDGRPGQIPFARGSRPAGSGWDVRQQHRDPDPAAANRAVLADLENGVSSLWLLLGPDGMPVEELPRVLDGVYLDLVSIVLDAGGQTSEAAERFLGLVAELEPAEVRGNLGSDPIGLAARTGGVPDLSVAVALAERVADYPNLAPITVDASIYHDAGGSDSDELAISLAVGVAYLRALTDAGQDLATAFGSLEFRYAVTANQFDSIAKLRAARLAWDRVGELSGLGSDRPGQRQHAVTSAAMMTRRDPWVNLLRTTIGCFAAAVGGAESITVAPFDAALGLPDGFGRRIARNTQSVLHDEASLARVADPAGGSFYVEKITEQLAGTAWQKFTELERAGGAVAALASGAIAELLDRSWQCRRDNLAHRRDPITGVSEFAMADEQQLSRPELPVATSGGLPRHRYAEPFEALRDRSDAQLAATGARPKVFLAALGPLAAHSARVSFASNLLAVGGIEAVLASGDPDELATAFAASGATVACLCSADAVYAEQAAAVVAALRAAGAQRLWIAGKAELATGGIDEAIFLGCDALARLQSLYPLEGAPA
ncbi:MAG: methylmalonyl-CoA mutase subunit beta [Actinomycetota bacterium]|nr:methylmalonyl-CoA mutase subunit beta [Actinomycetota bacterium]MDQ2956610.1 methylmalonyl-CoA mutase subunit beta [Actinomycetota bacterium]